MEVQAFFNICFELEFAYLKDEEGSPSKGSNYEQNRSLNPISFTWVSGVLRYIVSWVVHVLRPEEIDDLALIQCHQHGPSNCYYSSNHLSLASHSPHVQLLHPNLSQEESNIHVNSKNRGNRERMRWDKIKWLTICVCENIYLKITAITNVIAGSMLLIAHE